ncbi:MAG: STAS domain-containing protein [Spirochaetaceae bacterium]|nr:MAG: STAS domain-containing protein [Spirochaetaceae bacterium]
MITVEQKKKPPRTSVEISGKLTFAEVSELYAGLKPALQDVKRLELNLENVTGIDLAGYQLLLSLAKTLKENKVPLSVVPGTCRERIEKIGNFAGLPQPFVNAEGWDA